MDSTKYVSMDVHKETISTAVMNSSGKLVMESILETKAATILQFIQGLRGNLQVTFEEGTWAAWLYDLLKPYATKVVVCDPRRNALLKTGNKSDRIDARKLAELLRNGSLSAVYHGEKGLRTLKELSRSYLTLSRDLTRVMNRLKALYHSWGIACAGTQVYAPRHRSEWLSKIREAGVRCRAEFIYQQLDGLRALRQGVREPPGSGRYPESGVADRAHSDAVPVPHEAAAVGLQRSCDRDAQQWGIPLPGWSDATVPETRGASWS